MLFTSLDFVLLMAVTFFLYYLPVFKRSQVLLLVIASTIFYGWGGKWLLLLFFASFTINALASYLVVHGAARYRKLVATLGVVANLSILSFFKYSPLFATTFFDTSHGVGALLARIPLPLGISFFTFEGISLVVDAYKGRELHLYKGLVPRSILKHSLQTYFFVAFFPHLIAGPILKAHDFLPQISRKLFKDINWDLAFSQLVTGYFLKMVVADNLKFYTAWAAPGYFEHQSTVTLLTTLFGYSLQIFADFAGYSLIALGLATLFGYSLITNFNFPYISTSFSEFWRRWHISLSSFLREYLYIPLGGNRHGQVRTYFNLMITMLLGGLWHGAAWSYAVWGGAHGLALASERLLNDIIPRWPAGLLWKIFKASFVFASVSLIWLLFMMPKFDNVILFLTDIRANYWLEENVTIISYIILYGIPVIAYHALYLIWRHRPSYIVRLQPVLLGILLFLILTNSGEATSFIYFQF